MLPYRTAASLSTKRVTSTRPSNETISRSCSPGVGPAGPTPGEQDREIVSFDGRVLVTRFVDKDAAVRYGNIVYVRCAPRA